MITFINATCSFKKNAGVKNLNFSIDDGEFVLITGLSGGGKSSLCRCLNGLIPHFYAGTMGGNVSVMGLNTKKASISSLTRYIAYIPQRIGSALITPHVLTELAFSLEMAGLKREIISKRISNLVEEFQIVHLLHRNPQTLSDGEKQLITILSALIREPEIIIADAEVKAEKILNRAHNRLSQLHEDITELKRQRMQIEVQIRSIIETHTKLLDMGKEETKILDDVDSKVKLLKHTDQF